MLANYHPITATPFRRDEEYREIEPCEVLAPYIRCFWGSERTYVPKAERGQEQIVVPDTCADIMDLIDYTDNDTESGFCGICDSSFIANGNSGLAGHKISMFAIRFYAWGVYPFSEDSLKGSLNQYAETPSRFTWLDRELRVRLPETSSLEERVRITEQLLLQKMESRRSHPIIDETMTNILLHGGSLESTTLAKDAFISLRQLERLFHEYIGITPKKLSSMIRYQNLWRDVVCRDNFNIQDAVYRYGYTDQSHLMREFRKYHRMDIQNARQLAFQK